MAWPTACAQKRYRLMCILPLQLLLLNKNCPAQSMTCPLQVAADMQLHPYCNPLTAEPNAASCTLTATPSTCPTANGLSTLH
jgi:hypothetical protein